MSEPENRARPDPYAEPGAGGEYRFTRDSIYSDAHFEPAGASTEPPRYYTPPQRSAHEPKPRRKAKRGVGLLGPVLLTLAGVILGGALGATVAGYRAEQQLSALEQRLNESMAQQVSELDSRLRIANAAESASGGLSGAQIFESGKEQVVGIRTDVTYTNFFGMTSSTAVNGSGFILSEDGYILTNYHVIETAYLNRLSVSVMTYDGTEYTASIVGFEAANDIAVLKIEANGLHAATLGDSDAIVMGETVYAIGNPLGELAYSMSTGTVSGLNRVIVTEEAAGGINMFQIDAAVNHGNSGGPVYNSRGEVIGVVTAKSGDTDAEGIGFAVPIKDAASIAGDLMTKGYVTGRAAMGVRLDERYNGMYAQFYGLPLGAYVYSVDSGSAAENAGVQPGDIITAVGRTEISSYTQLQSAVRSFSAGDSAEVQVYRSGELLSLTIVFDEARPAGAESSNQVLDSYSSGRN